MRTNILRKLSIAVILSATFAAAYAAAPHDQTIAKTHWQGTTVMSEGKDVTQFNGGFIGLAKYDAKTNHYEFFDKETKESRGDFGVFFITKDGKKRILISEGKKYNAIVDMTEGNAKGFTYERMGKADETKEARVAVAHVPYKGDLKFTTVLPALTKSTGKIDTQKAGIDILGGTFWQGTVAKDAAGNDVSEFNKGFLGLAHYDAKTGKYEFFDKETGKTRGDFGYYDVIRNNKQRAHVSIGMKYAAVLELTELNSGKFTYARKGKDATGQDIDITVEHIPYQGDFKLDFTF